MNKYRLALTFVCLGLVYLALLCALALEGGGVPAWGYASIILGMMALMAATGNCIAYMVEQTRERPFKVGCPNYQYMKLKRKLKKDLKEYCDDPSTLAGVKTAFIVNSEQAGVQIGFAEDDYDELLEAIRKERR